MSGRLLWMQRTIQLTMTTTVQPSPDCTLCPRISVVLHRAHHRTTMIAAMTSATMINGRGVGGTGSRSSPAATINKGAIPTTCNHSSPPLPTGCPKYETSFPGAAEAITVKGPDAFLRNRTDQPAQRRQAPFAPGRGGHVMMMAGAGGSAGRPYCCSYR
jgi:hypothetical protein